jgi:hypothetical protein
LANLVKGIEYVNSTWPHPGGLSWPHLWAGVLSCLLTSAIEVSWGP